MHFKVTDNNLFKDNPELLSIPEFKPFQGKEKVLKWVFFVYDYVSPYRRLPINKRKELVANKLLYSENKRTKFDRYVDEVLAGGIGEVQQAIGAFKEIQYDEDRETMDALDEAVRDIKYQLRSPSASLTQAANKSKLVKALREMEEERKKLREIFDFREEYEEDDEEVILNVSLLDEILDNEDD
jgi:hypothetical protein